MIWLALIGLGGLTMFISRLLGNAGDPPDSSVVEEPTPTSPTRAQLIGILQEHRGSIVWRTLTGLGCVCCGALLFRISEVVALLLLMSGTLMLVGAVGRAWAIGSWSLDGWYSAEIALWYVADIQIEEDIEGDVKSVMVRGCPAEMAARIDDHPDCLRWLSVRIRPSATSCNWKGKCLVVLTRADGQQLACLHGEKQFYRAGGESPSDWMKSRVASW